MNKCIQLFFFVFVALSQGKVLTNFHAIAMDQKPQYKSMRILFMINRFPWYTKSMIVNQLVGLLDLGHDVHLFAKEKMNGYQLDSAFKKYNFSKNIYYKNFPKDLNSYDIIVFQDGNIAKEFCHIKQKYGLTAKLVTFFRGADVTNKNQALSNRYKNLFDCGNCFLPVCEYFSFRLRVLGCPVEKIAVHYSGVDCKKFVFHGRIGSKNKICLMSVGRLVEKKGLRYAIEAVAKLVKKYPKIKYIIVGDGKERANLTRLIKKLGVQNNVKLLGWKTQEAIVKLLHESDIFVLPSITTSSGSEEGIANALKEAMLCGVPVISTFHAGTIELIDNDVTGLLVQQRDVMSLVKAIKNLIDHPHKRKAFSRAGRKKVERMFDSKRLNQQFESLLLGLL